MDAAEVGHRALPHTADLIIEAWAPTRGDCFEQAVLALADSFADTRGVPVSEPLPLEIDPAPPEELLVAVLEEVIYLLDVFEVVPVDVVVVETDEGGLSGSFGVTPLDAVETTGPSPKAVARSGLILDHDGDLWTCRALVDV